MFFNIMIAVMRSLSSLRPERSHYVWHLLFLSLKACAVYYESRAYVSYLLYDLKPVLPERSSRFDYIDYNIREPYERSELYRTVYLYYLYRAAEFSEIALCYFRIFCCYLELFLRVVFKALWRCYSEYACYWGAGRQVVATATFRF